MALLFIGSTLCTLCDKVVNEGDSYQSFPAFIMNELDPCFIFTDGAFHEACVRNHAQGADALRRVDEWKLNVGPGRRKCAVCGHQVTEPDDYLLIGKLSDCENDPLRLFNYTHLHRSCVSRWNRASAFVDLASAALGSGSWKGGWLAQLIEDVKASL